MTPNEKNTTQNRLIRKLAITSLKFCVSYHSRYNIDCLSKELEECLNKYGAEIRPSGKKRRKP